MLDSHLKHLNHHKSYLLDYCRLPSGLSQVIFWIATDYTFWITTISFTNHAYRKQNSRPATLLNTRIDISCNGSFTNEVNSRITRAQKAGNRCYQAFATIRNVDVKLLCSRNKFERQIVLNADVWMRYLACFRC